jgi:hypothetical protein
VRILACIIEKLRVGSGVRGVDWTNACACAALNAYVFVDFELIFAFVNT